MKVREFKAIEQAIHVGVGLGWARAHKHMDDPGEDAIKDAIALAVMNEICGWFDFGDAEKADQ